MDKTVFVVSGYMRSGTSMMMKCLEAGGMEAKHNLCKDRILNDRYAREDYQPNPGGFYELGPREFNHPDFPKIYANKLIKVLHWRLPGLPPFKYKIIFMLRDPQEIEVSFLKMFRRRPPFVLHKYDALMKKILTMLQSRPDIETLPVQHRDVIRDPLKVFATIKDNHFPVIDIEKAAAAVNPALYRSKRTDLDQVRQSIPGLCTDLPECIRLNIS
ncbi:MAG: hypothetical protein KKH68_02835 [Proteobacteria bacterium]|nr:hypothetical protein [Pseudomonadota bacterium]